MNQSLPKLSYVLLSHNREKYIRNAIACAFAQDYDGELEYVFSDDCSTDNTFEIIKECVAAYKGPRKVIVTQTPRNMNLAGHTNHAVALATGEWIIRADDDDIFTVDRCSVVGRTAAEHPDCTYVLTGHKYYTPERVAETMELASKPHAFDVNDVIIVDARKDKNFLNWFSKLHLAWKKTVYTEFAPLPEDGYYVDDWSCFYRANFIGNGAYAPVVTAHICVGSLNMSTGENTGGRGYSDIIRQEKFNDKYANLVVAPLTALVNELSNYIVKLPEEQRPRYEEILKQLQNRIDKIDYCRSFWRKGIINRIRITHATGKWSWFNAIRCLPMPVFAFLLSLARKFKRKK